MSRGTHRRRIARELASFATSIAAAISLAPSSAAHAQAAGQQIDQEYTAKIKEYLQDPRISTELVDHLPASSTVPTPLKFLGRIVGTPGELTYAKDIHRCLEALAKASPVRSSGRSARPRKGATWWCWRSPTRRRSPISTGTRPITRRSPIRAGRATPKRAA